MSAPARSAVKTSVGVNAPGTTMQSCALANRTISVSRCGETKNSAPAANAFSASATGEHRARADCHFLAQGVVQRGDHVQRARRVERDFHHVHVRRQQRLANGHGPLRGHAADDHDHPGCLGAHYLRLRARALLCLHHLGNQPCCLSAASAVFTSFGNSTISSISSSFLVSFYVTAWPSAIRTSVPARFSATAPLRHILNTTLCGQIPRHKR